jgi:cytochrome b6-f complex iron-sulfur subunit
MDRKEFLVKFGISATAICAACILGCSEDSTTGAPTPPENVDFSLDLNASENSALKTNGGYIYKDGLIIGRVNESTYVAVSQYCTHQGTTVQFEAGSSRFHCSNHGSNFNLSGGIINGPASTPLKKYNTELNGNTLRVYS